MLKSHSLIETQHAAEPRRARHRDLHQEWCKSGGSGHLLGLALHLGDLAGRSVDDTDGNRHAHVADGKATQRGVRLERLDDEGAHGLKENIAGIARLDVLRVLLNNLVGTAIDLVLDLQ